MSRSRLTSAICSARYSLATWVREISPRSSPGSLRIHSGSWERSSPCSEVQPDHTVVRTVANSEPIRAHAVPFLNHEAMIFEERADLAGSESGDLFQHGHEHAERVVTDHRALGDVRHLAGLRGGDREAIAAIHMQHDGNVRLPVAHVYDLITRHDVAGADLLDGGHLSTSRCRAGPPAEILPTPVPART